ncbi:uncharacterized protein LOC135830891 isoform X2 [Sycon ciliatum]|uniref:uncharacterized protein LOC135830891 isoform X2 n=1 Tax=Sycon ciliatum TaxID=27933 RepID=UPI0031F62167
MEVDEGLQSRQLAVYGRESMRQLRTAKVLVIGSDGLAAEICKNVILANVGALTICDLGRKVVPSHLSSHFFVAEADVGQSVAGVSLPRFQELNDAVTVSAVQQLPESLDGYTTVVCVGVDFAESCRINELCRGSTKQLSFIRCGAHGLYGNVFCDFGDAFCVNDWNGETPAVVVVSGIADRGGSVLEVHCYMEGNKSVPFCSGDVVRFTEVQGMAELNGLEFEVLSATRWSFEIRKPANMSSEYITGGIATEIKQPVVHKFQSLKESLTGPGAFVQCGYHEPGHSAMLHVYAQALDKFLARHSTLPQPGAKEHVDEVVELVTEVASDLKSLGLRSDTIDYALVRRMAATSSSVISPMAAIMGGIVGQEVVKASTGKFSPLRQWCHMEFYECLAGQELSYEEVQPTGSRYDDMVAVFGKTFQEELAQLKYFMVGCGALGCEFLKNFAMMGVACGLDGSITVTDDDIIERSNLTRQFLFRNRDVGRSKSAVAARAVKAMNPDISLAVHQDRLCADTEAEAVFNCDFWKSLDGVCNALDNAKARMYVDGKCVQYGLSLLESGTLGTQGNVQVILPHKTVNYGQHSDKKAGQVPVCVLHNFPHTMEHCLPLGRSEFAGLFEVNPEEVNKYVSSASGHDYVQCLKDAGSKASDILDKLRGHKIWGGGMVDWIGHNRRPKVFEDCVTWARRKYENYFVNTIIQLTAIFPESHRTSSGAAFWTPPKRFPRPVAFDSNDAMCLQFVISASNLCAKVFGIKVPASNRDEAYFKPLLEKVSIPEFTPSKNVVYETEDDNVSPHQPDDGEVDDSETVRSLLEMLPAPGELKEDSFCMHAEEFEKDEDTNFHMDFVGALGNLRARNYSIQEVDKLEAKLKAGNIIPAIATTTAMVTGFVCLELCKIVNNVPVTSHRNLFANLAIPFFTMSEPEEAPQIRSRVEMDRPDNAVLHHECVETQVIAYPEGHTLWDHLCVNNDHDFTLQEFIDHFHSKDGLTVTFVTVLSTHVILFSTMHPHMQQRRQEHMTPLISTVGKLDITNRKEALLAVAFTRGESKAIVDENPPVKYNLFT